MKLGNVLVIGNSGVGKSTLINAIVKENVAITGFGTEGTTKELCIYEAEDIPFRLIDTVGFEPSFFKARKAVGQVKKWSKESVEEEGGNKEIDIIWFCVDGTSSKLFSETLDNLTRATSIWPSVPVIVVITKSYSEADRVKNIEMVNSAFAKMKRSVNVKKVVPVVASVYKINDEYIVPNYGIEELVSLTNELLPEGVQAAKADIARFKLNRKRIYAQSVVGTATTSAAVIGAVPIKIPDGTILAQVEMAEITALARIYGIKKDNGSAAFFETIIQIGTVGMLAKTAVSFLKTIPNIAASVVNAVVAGAIVASLGEGCVYVFEQIYLGKKTVEDIEWLKQVMESKVVNELSEKLTAAMKNITDKTDVNAVVKMLADLFLTRK